mmetsp:Transcript_21539/g.46698  ORF Transcript_21539/g.46698 Transcript_21539/m.46698 type:complete len:203 (-) Transcript_21539:98-706(-)
MIKFLQKKKMSPSAKHGRKKNAAKSNDLGNVDETDRTMSTELDASLRTVQTLFHSDDEEGETRSAMASGKKRQGSCPKKVSFSTIELRYHAIMLGDNPSVSSGPPLALSNNVIHTDTCSLDDYEGKRPQNESEPQKSALILNRFEREDRLRDAGFGRADFRQAEAEIQRIKKPRETNGTTANKAGGLMGRLGGLAKRVARAA